MGKNVNGGGRQPGAGRPKGSTNKVTITALVKAIESKCGDSFENLVAEGYQQSIKDNDTGLRFSYERMLMNKIVIDADQAAMIDSINQQGGFKISFIPTKKDDEDKE